MLLKEVFASDNIVTEPQHGWHDIVIVWTKDNVQQIVGAIFVLRRFSVALADRFRHV